MSQIRGCQHTVERCITCKEEMFPQDLLSPMPWRRCRAHHTIKPVVSPPPYHMPGEIQVTKARHTTRCLCYSSLTACVFSSPEHRHHRRLQGEGDSHRGNTLERWRLQSRSRSFYHEQQCRRDSTPITSTVAQTCSISDQVAGVFRRIHQYSSTCC